ncbi:MAG: amidase [Dehalococcoidia bacterium]|nr:amidase [Dehalococcoidia bacterium]
MGTSDMVFLSATELSARMKAGELSPLEVTEAYLERIAAVDSKVNSYVTLCADEALEAARQAGSEIAAGRYRGPMHGVPIAIKDQIHTEGILTTDGSRVRAGFIPQEDATVVTRLKDAGAVLLGKLNMSEFALGEPVSSLTGPARNPWDLERTPGGSSTGSGAATAAFLCATSLGEDTGGSIRNPAANCGLAGLRPSWGRVSRYGVDGACWSIDTVGPISRTVSDCAMTLGAIAGHDPRDPYSSPAPVQDYLGGLTGDVKGLRVGLVREFLDTPDLGVGQATRDAVLSAAEVLRGQGADVMDVSLPMVVFSGPVTRTISHVERVSIHPDWLRERGEEHHYVTRVGFTTANLLPGHVYLKALRLREMIRREVLGAFDRVDVLVHPIASAPAGRLVEHPTVASKEQAYAALVEGSFRGPYSLSGAPAICVPCGFEDGLPLSLQIAGRPFDEPTVLRAAHAYEQATEWHRRRPPI